MTMGSPNAGIDKQERSRDTYNGTLAMSTHAIHCGAERQPIPHSARETFNVVPSSSIPSSPRQVPLSKSLRERKNALIPTLFRLPQGPAYTPEPASTPSPSFTACTTINTKLRTSFTPDPDVELTLPVQVHIPRPPNAFMLFRSDFLRRGVIPSHVERRQQNLSRIAGQVWNLMGTEEKRTWHEAAAKVLAEHQEKNPGYKFTPVPRGVRKAGGKARGRGLENEGLGLGSWGDAGKGVNLGGATRMTGNESGIGSVKEKLDGEERIRRIREEYACMPGPAVPSLRRKRRRNHGQQTSADTTSSCRTTDEREFLSSRVSSTPMTMTYVRSESTDLPPFFPQNTFPHIPLIRSNPAFEYLMGWGSDLSTGGSESGLSRPSSTGKILGRNFDLDITPTTTHFATPGETKSSSPLLFPASFADARDVPSPSIGSSSSSSTQSLSSPTLDTAAPLSLQDCDAFVFDINSFKYPEENMMFPMDPFYRNDTTFFPTIQGLESLSFGLEHVQEGFVPVTQEPEEDMNNSLVAPNWNFERLFGEGADDSLGCYFTQ